MKNPELIRAVTPIVLAGIGCVIGVFALVNNPQDSAGLGLAGTAIAGASGLANAGKNETD